MSKEFVDVHNLIVATAQHYHFPAPPKLILLVQEILTSLLRTLLTLLAALLSILPGYTDTRAASDFIKVGLYAMGLVGAFLFIWLLWTRLHELGKQANLAKAGGLASEGSFTAAAWQEQALAFCRAKRWKDACRAMLLASIRLLDEYKVVPFMANRTNFEYGYCLDSRHNLRCHFKLIAEITDNCWFGNKMAEESDFNQCLTAFESIQSELIEQDKSALSINSAAQTG